MADSVRLAASDFKTVATGQHAEVRLSPGAKAEYDKIAKCSNELDTKKFRQLQRFMDRFCEKQGLSDQQFKKEGDFPAKNKTNKTVAVYEFKPWQWRLYGAILTINGKQCFVGTRVDPSKKKNKADKKALEMTAEDIGKLQEFNQK